MNKKLLFQIIQVILTIALVCFIVLKAEEFFSHVDWSLVAQNWLYVVLSGVFFLTGYMFMAKHWQLACELIQPKVNKKQWLAYFASQPYKYLPTSFFTFSFRAVYAKKLGMDIKKSSEAQLIENANLIGSALGLGMLLVVFLTNILAGLAITAAIGALCYVIWRYHFVHIPKTRIKLNLRRWLKTVAVVTAGWVVMGLGFSMIGFALEAKPDIFVGIAANSLATGFGILAVFAPGGIGIRELVFSFFLYASTTILIWRLTTFTIDILAGVWSIWFISRSQK